MAAVTSIIAAGTTLASTGMSIAQASKQNKLAVAASEAADDAFKKAEAQLDVNYFEQLGISKTPYENQREAIAQSAAQAMEVGKESERGGAATAGRVLAQSNVAQQGITDNQTKDLEALQKLVATEEARLGTAKSDLSLAQAEGAGIASAQAQNASNAAVQSAVSGVADFGMGMYQNSELYKQNPTTPDSTTPAANNADSFGVFASDANPYPQVVPSQNMILPMTPAQQFQNTSAMFNLQNPQLINQNIPNPLDAFMQPGVNGSGLTQEQYLNLINPRR
jgi:hypothetical protein